MEMMLERSKVLKLTLCALFVALTAIGAFIRIPTPLAPFSLQVLFVMMAGIVLGSKLGLASQLAYIFIGLAGIPIFTQGGGPSYVFQPSFGFLLGFAAAAFVIGKVTEHMKQLTVKGLFAAGLAGLAAIYMIGLPYLYLIVNVYLGGEMPVSAVLWSACAIFLPGDMIKIFIAAVLSKKILQAIQY